MGPMSNLIDMNVVSVHISQILCGVPVLELCQDVTPRKFPCSAPNPQGCSQQGSCGASPSKDAVSCPVHVRVGVGGGKATRYFGRSCLQ